MSLMPLEEAWKILKQWSRPVCPIDQLDLNQALGTVLAQTQFSQVDVPPADISAMDGYAFRHKDVTSKGPARLTVSQRIPAGTPAQPLTAGTIARVFTGSEIPTGADTVIRQEDCEITAGGEVIFTELPTAGKDIRTAGQNMAVGDPVVEAGTRLEPQHLALLASVGIARLPCYKALRVGLLCTGSELVAPGQPLQPGQIYNSNHASLEALIDQLGMYCVDAGQVRDDPVTLQQRLEQLAGDCDVVITSGGVSVGEEDHVKAVLEKLGTLDHWKLAIRPGKPVVMGHIRQTPVFGLPGNPVSAFVIFLILVAPFLRALQGRGWAKPSSIWFEAGFNRENKSGRDELARVRLRHSDSQSSQLEVYPESDSSMIRSTTWAEGLALIPAHSHINRGDRVKTYLYSELFR